MLKSIQHLFNKTCHAELDSASLTNNEIAGQARNDNDIFRNNKNLLELANI